MLRGERSGRTRVESVKDCVKDCISFTVQRYFLLDIKRITGKYRPVLLVCFELVCFEESQLNGRSVRAV